MSPLDLSSGDYVEHRRFPNTIWRVIELEPYTTNGGQAKLSWIGGNKISYEDSQSIFTVYRGGDVAPVRDLHPANAMLVIALEAR